MVSESLTQKSQKSQNSTHKRLLPPKRTRSIPIGNLIITCDSCPTLTMTMTPSIEGKTVMVIVSGHGQKNPCCGGNRSRRDDGYVFKVQRIYSLNPCCSGNRFRRGGFLWHCVTEHYLRKKPQISEKRPKNETFLRGCKNKQLFSHLKMR